MRGLAAGLDDVGGGEQRHHRLARADVALQQAQHALGLGEVGLDLGECRLLAAGQREGQGGDELRAERPSPCRALPVLRRWCSRISDSASWLASNSS